MDDITDKLQLEQRYRGLFQVSTSRVETDTGVTFNLTLVPSQGTGTPSAEERRCREHVHALENELIGSLQLQTDAGIFTRNETGRCSLGTERSNISPNSPQVP